MLNNINLFFYLLFIIKMLEGLLEKFILQYFGDFIENLDRNQMSIGVSHFMNY
jgi:hypothetical protein